MPAETGQCYVKYVNQERCKEAYYARRELLGTHGVHISLFTNAALEKARAQVQQPGRLALGMLPACLQPLLGGASQQEQHA